MEDDFLDLILASEIRKEIKHSMYHLKRAKYLYSKSTNGLFPSKKEALELLDVFSGKSSKKVKWYLFKYVSKKSTSGLKLQYKLYGGSKNTNYYRRAYNHLCAAKRGRKNSEFDIVAYSVERTIHGTDNMKKI